MKKIDLARHAPPGMELGRYHGMFSCGMVAASLYSMRFLTRFGRLRSLLYNWDETGKTLREGAEMADFAYIVDGALLVFYILAFAMLMTAILNYAYHRQGSRSIYLMKRLPNRWELHRRCLTIPLVGAALCLLAAFVVLLLYFGYYMIATPEQCLTPDQWQKIWR